ncbi:DUF4307 domain-containing protein [Actinoplanes sp. CA-142083]|uniref:DUF4307 domain-containing protein n=1 Tax=Actinoplanes sp. CA-142083 TaxID=3239903 RepID=UPI003D94D46C
MDPAILADPTDKKRTRGGQVSETHTTNPVFPPGRYGHRREGRRRPVVPILILMLVVAASVLISLKLYQRYGQTDYQPQIVGWQDPTDTTMTIKFTVQVPAGGKAECVLRARDYGGNEVGRRTVVVKAADAGATTIEAEEPVTTSKRGSVGDVLSCQPAG